MWRAIICGSSRLPIPSPLGGEGQGEGMSVVITLSCVLSPQGRGEKDHSPHPIFKCVMHVGAKLDFVRPDLLKPLPPPQWAQRSVGF